MQNQKTCLFEIVQILFFKVVVKTFRRRKTKFIKGFLCVFPNTVIKSFGQNAKKGVLGKKIMPHHLMRDREVKGMCTLILRTNFAYVMASTREEYF